LFYTTGAAVQRQEENYAPYALKNGVYDRGWPGLLPVLDDDWKPDLDGKIDRAEAERRLVRDYATTAP